MEWENDVNMWNENENENENITLLYVIFDWNLG